MPMLDIPATKIAAYAKGLFDYEQKQFSYAQHKKTLAEWEQQIANDIAAIRVAADHFDEDAYMRCCYANIVRLHTYNETAKDRLQKLIEEMQSAKAFGNEENFYAEFKQMCVSIKTKKEKALTDAGAIEKYISDKGITDKMLADLIIPPEFLCPILYNLMINPVKTSLAQTYDYKNIKQWLDNCLTDPKTEKQVFMDPVTGATMPNDHLLPDHERREDILLFLEAHFGPRLPADQILKPRLGIA
jgi:hypothetical protein